MLKVSIPGDHIPERKYIIGTLLSGFLGLDFGLFIDKDIRHYSISFENSEIIIKDFFFALYPDGLSYLISDALPEKIIRVNNAFIKEKDIPVIFGTDQFEIDDKKFICGIDIFASSFFMLTRWEEYVSRIRDEHKRFPHTESIAYKYGIMDRPVVNEYVEMLWSILLRAGYNGVRKTRSFNLVLTHDIDHLDYPGNVRIIAGDVLKRKDLKLAREHFRSYVISGSNPYDTFNFIMSASEKLGISSHFYFMSSATGLAPDTKFYLNSARFRSKIREIKQRGHKIGFHPGYYTFDDPLRWRNEKLLLERVSETDIAEGRQHYLRMEVPDTLRIWSRNNMKIDSTLGYANKEGFRCGTGDIFPIFDFLERVQLNVWECPLIIMDGTLKRHYTLDEALSMIQYYFTVCRKYNSALTLLFHNSTFYGEGWEGYDSLYTKALGQ